MALGATGTMVCWAALACVLGTAAGRASAGSRTVAAEAPGPACLGVSVSASPPSTDRQGTNKGFSARRVLDLSFRVALPLEAQPESLALRLFTPNGHLYQQVDVPIAPEGSRESERALAGYPFPVKVARVRTGRAPDGVPSRAVDAPPLPVAGTTIVSSSLYGRWRAEAWLAGAPEACSAEFNILP